MSEDETIAWLLPKTTLNPISTLLESTPIDYLDFASPVSGLGGKMGLDATNKLPPETNREWGRKLRMSPEVTEKITNIWGELGLPGTGTPIWK